MKVLPFFKPLWRCPRCDFDFGGEVQPAPNVMCSRCEECLWPQLWRLWRNPRGEVHDTRGSP